MNSRKFEQFSVPTYSSNVAVHFHSEGHSIEESFLPIDILHNNIKILLKAHYIK
jgi:hypothetical protein